MLRWDLDGMCDEELLSNHCGNISFIFYYIIGNLFYSSDFYTRQGMFSSSFEFTTSELIYKYTGIYSIRFTESSVLSPVSIHYKSLDYMGLANSNFDFSCISDITFCGNTDMLVLYGSAIQYSNTLLASKSNLLKLELIGLGVLDSPISLNLYLSDYVYCLCDDKYNLFHRLPNINFVVDLKYIDALLDCVYNIDFKYPMLEILDITQLSRVSDFPYELLSNRFNVVYILLTRSYIYRTLHFENLKSLINDLRLSGVSNVKFKYKDSLVKKVPHDLQVLLGDYLED